MPYTILVTGANKGIGYEAVKLLSQLKPDATILLGSRSIQNGNDAIARMRSSLPSHPFSNVSTIQIDITSPSSLRSAVEHVKSTYHTLDVLLHNSGISHVGGDFKSSEIFNVNVRGAKDTIEAFAPILTPKSGTIVLVSSSVAAWYMSEVDPATKAALKDISSVSWDKVEGWMKDWDVFAAGGQSADRWIPLDKGLVATKYCVTKAILNPWMRKWAADHPEVKVAVVCPGYCATDINDHPQDARPAVEGGKSVIWPVLNEFESGKFYLDGIEKPYDSFSIAEYPQLVD